MSIPRFSSLASSIPIYKTNKREIKVPDRLKCCICKYILFDAVQTECGCRYCKQCLENYLESGNTKCVGFSEDCPDLNKNYIQDIATNKEISLMKVKCMYEQCSFEDTFRGMTDHFKVCEYKQEKCSLCGELYVIRNKSDHLNKECERREIKCRYCNNSITFYDFNTNHLEIESEKLCPKYVDKCPYKCTEENEVNLNQHRHTCINRPIPCPLHSFGCNDKVPKNEIVDHLTSKSHQHYQTVVGEIEKLQLQIKEMDNKMNNLIDENKSLHTVIETMTEDFNKEVSKLKLYQKTPESSLCERIVHRNGKYIWKICDFSKLKECAIKGRNINIISDPFYTSEFGYKMCLKIYPNGDGIGKGTHLSVFFALMKGEFDDLLQWPFKNKIVITIIDDLTKSSNHTDTFKPDVRSICYQKPQDIYNIASGSPQFISFDALTNFLKRDTLYIQICVAL